MNYRKDTLEFHIEEPCVLTLGKFDGLHLGHRYLMEEMRRGRQQGLTSVVFTFDIPPRSLTENDCRVLTTNAEKLKIFEQAGVDELVECRFTDDLRRMTPYEFLSLLTAKINVKRIVAGRDFCFGYRRSGTWRELVQYSSQFGYETVIVSKKQYKGEDISSTRIRACVAEGNMEEAAALLGYSFFVSAPVLVGNQIGKTIGFPTANQRPPQEKLLPPNGVYAVKVQIDGIDYYGMSDIGRKPTVEGEYPVGIETNIFDFEGDLYGQDIQVSFLKYIRPEKKFENLDELSAQIAADKAAIAAYFEERRQTAGWPVYMV